MERIAYKTVGITNIAIDVNINIGDNTIKRLVIDAIREVIDTIERQVIDTTERLVIHIIMGQVINGGSKGQVKGAIIRQAIGNIIGNMETIRRQTINAMIRVIIDAIIKQVDIIKITSLYYLRFDK